MKKPTYRWRRFGEGWHAVNNGRHVTLVVDFPDYGDMQEAERAVIQIVESPASLSRIEQELSRGRL